MSRSALAHPWGGVQPQQLSARPAWNCRTKVAGIDCGAIIVSLRGKHAGSESCSKSPAKSLF